MPVREENQVFWEILDSALSQLSLEFSRQPSSHYSNYEEENRKKEEEVTRKEKKTSKPRRHNGRKPIPVVVLTKKNKSSGGVGGSKTGPETISTWPVGLSQQIDRILTTNFQIQIKGAVH